MPDILKIFSQSTHYCDRSRTNAHAAATVDNLLSTMTLSVVMRCHPRLTRVHHLLPKVRRPCAPSDPMEPTHSVCRGASSTSGAQKTEVLFARRTSNSPYILFSPSAQRCALSRLCVLPHTQRATQLGQAQPRRTAQCRRRTTLCPVT